MTMLPRSSFGKKRSQVNSKKNLEPVMVQGSLHLPGVQKIIQRQDYTPEEALAEFIDNSYSARVGANVRVQIDITKNSNGWYTLRIDDDASGIPSDSLAQVLSYGLSLGKGNNNEHGAGMKQAASAGNTYLRKIESTAAAGDAFAVEFKNANALYEPVQMQKSERKKRGTMFELELPPSHALLNEDGYAHIVQRLQVMYQKTLGQSLFITMRNAALNNDKARTLIPDNVSKYVYNPAFDNNTWLVKGHVLQGNGWSAKINVGYLPERSNPFLLRKGALPNANEQSQYNAEQKGLYIFKKERLVGQLDSWKMHASLPKAFAGNSDNLKNLVLEIEVDDGIATVPTKTALANPPQDDNTVDTPLTELQNGLYKYLNRLTLDLQPDQTLVAPHLLGARGIHTLMQTIDLAERPKEKVGPASLDLSSLDPSWRAGWKAIAPFGDWKIWNHPLHEVCLVMHKSSASTQLDYSDIPNYALLQMHIEKNLSVFPKGIFVGHNPSDLLKQEHVPLNLAVHISTLRDLNQMLHVIDKNERIENSVTLPALSDFNLTTSQKIAIVEKLHQLKITSLAGACSWLNLDLDTIIKKDKSSKTTNHPVSLDELQPLQDLQQIRRLIQQWTSANNIQEQRLGVYNTKTSTFFPTVEDAALHLKGQGTTISMETLQSELNSGLTIGNDFWRRETLAELSARENTNLNVKGSLTYVKPRPVCLEHGRVFDSISDAVDWLISEGVPAKKTTLRASLNLDRAKTCYGLTWDNFKPGNIYSPLNPDAKPKLFEKAKIICLENNRVFDDAGSVVEWINAECEGEVQLKSVYHAVNKAQKLAGLSWARYDPSLVYTPSNAQIKPVLRKNQQLVCLEYGKVFDNGPAAVTWLNETANLDIVSPMAIITAIKNKSTAYGLTWSYAEPGRVYKPVEIKPPIKIRGGARPSEKAPHGIVCLETGVVYKTMQDACRWLRENGIPSPLLDRAIYGRQQTPKIYGLTWAIVDPNKKYVPTDKNALPKKAGARSIVCLNTARVFESATHVCEWIKKYGIDLSESHLLTSVKGNSTCAGLEWSVYEEGKVYQPTNPDAVPFHAKKMIFCSNTQETFKSITAFTKWLKEKSGHDISTDDTIKVVAGVIPHIEGYELRYAS